MVSPLTKLFLRVWPAGTAPGLRSSLRRWPVLAGGSGVRVCQCASAGCAGCAVPSHPSGTGELVRLRRCRSAMYAHVSGQRVRRANEHARCGYVLLLPLSALLCITPCYTDETWTSCRQETTSVETKRRTSSTNFIARPKSRGERRRERRAPLFLHLVQIAQLRVSYGPLGLGA